MFLLVVVDLPIALDELQHGYRKHDHQHDHRQCRCLGLVEPCEALLVDVEQQHRAGVVRCPLGHDNDVVDQLDAVGQRDGGDEQQRRSQQREGDLLECCPAGGPVDPRRLVQLARNVLQSGEEEDHEIARLLPDVHERHGRFDALLVGQHVHRFHAEFDQELVEHAAVGHVDEHPDAGYGYHGHDHGIEERGAQESDPLALAVHQRCERQTQHHAGDDGHDGEGDRIADDLPENRRTEQVHVVLQPDEFGFHHTQLISGEPEVYAAEDGKYGKCEQEYQRWSQEGPRDKVGLYGPIHLFHWFSIPYGRGEHQ